ncbi:MAG: sulfatase-like hydrolase/transferase [Armatimonadetes bacterium]|nr:sulfatase-like hydrolase/transferase [Armatimonadota bacterium]
MERRPNVVLCLCDQHRAFETGCYGNTVIRTPHLDRLAAEGVRFETAVTNAPVCMAARSVVLSGQYNRTCTGGVTNVAFQGRPGEHSMPEYPERGRPHLPDPTLPELLRAQGYRTAAIGKWHIHSWPDEVGFDDFVVPRVHHCHSGQSFTRNGGPEFVPPGWSVDFEVDEVEQLLAARSGDSEPFFLYYNLSPPHCPVADMPDEYLTMYAPDEIPLRPNVDLSQPLPNQDYWFKVYRYDFRHYMLHLPYADQLPDGYDLRWLIAEYYGMTTWMDAAVGRMLDALDRHGLAENTVVLFTSDHGDNLGSLGRVQKMSANEESIRVPMLLRYPAGLAPAVAREGVPSLVDVAPTLLELAGVDVPPHMAGQSLLPAARGGRLERDHAFIEIGKSLAVRTPERLCCLGRDASGDLAPQPSELFDLAADPYELRNLAAEDDGGELVERLHAWDRATPWMATA